MAADKPLSQHCLDALARLRTGPQPRQEFNPGVCKVLEARDLVEGFWGATPYRTRKGDIRWLKLTEAGVQASS